ncbi:MULTISPECIES: outer membrane protein assembly factor BamC [unclassified Undibacterium]|uniref:outer membrane protein assembly factor BamC n=1 Tax=unclassified Undibacterium TaxID=2630295 RepID=UPI002AC96BEC|nr:MULTISPECIES: outer membrane protein assembly factor BamC [unclassified Undibacterium]MEB0140932.1 outer membrane protein assembly factor BamC [Undibacterium sp. CCC2.1]MEB0173151.1 outer membrane protein assembly factor BamC [Undibacterium sp. CCC1.1]MEB0177873.1 outer membrane protein assembly factor BamC [Undibacterium sp. CCC3.4]MEB0216142.1 outer membrane protein assembly factor BamC [Undibacterium sp. 5I2]WPX42809.1 outer membrane protein assembly factor BamC [Undibacterium sp. CCC3.4
MAKSFVAKNGIIGVLAIAGLSACSSVGNLIEPNKIDYKSAAKATSISLDVPPDLTQIARDNRFAVPDANKSSATASGYNLEKGNKVSVSSAVVAPTKVNDMRIVRSGSERWLVVKQTPEALWPQLKDFWQELGFLVNVENQQTGVMETDWAENRAKIPQDLLRNTLGKVLDSLYSTGERDKFRTRLERGENGEVEIYISHRGAEEVLTGPAKDGSAWTPRAPDPGLEAEFLARLMARLSSDGVASPLAPAAVTAVELKPHSKLIKTADASQVEVDEGFDRAWRRVGLALDRVGFTVEDRDRSQGLYFVRYIDQDIEAKTKGAGDGFFSKLFSSNSDEASKNAQKYRVSVKNAANGESSVVTVLNNDGKVDRSVVAEKILKLLNDQLK